MEAEEVGSLRSSSAKADPGGGIPGQVNSQGKGKDGVNRAERGWGQLSTGSSEALGLELQQSWPHPDARKGNIGGWV
jgi:hypothetical protein